MTVITRESDLAPVAGRWLRELGYDIRSEVHHIDILGRNPDGLFHAVELKKTFNIDVLSQGLRGQRWAGEATVVVPKPSGTGFAVARKMEEWGRICRAMSLGLCLVRSGDDGLEIKSEIASVRVSKGRADMRKYFDKEFNGRGKDRNVAGMPGTRLHTAYSEKAMRIARWLIDRALDQGSLEPTHCREIAAGSKYADARSVMYCGFKEYFEKFGKGYYGLGRGVLTDAQAISEVTGDFDLARLSGLFASA